MKKLHRNTLVGGSAVLVSLSCLCTIAGAAPQGDWQAHTTFKIRDNSTSTYQSGFTPAQIRHAYGIDQLSQTGANETVAIVDAYGSPTISSDLNTFDSQFGLAAANLTVHNMASRQSTNGGWALETSLDVECVHAIAPQAKILLVEAKSASTTDLLSAIDYATSAGAQVVSNSWGGSETSGEASYDSHFQHTGVVYTASAGDTASSLEWPACSSYVLSVGGTSLTTDSSGNYTSESAWSSSGGGPSTYIPRPAYQTNWSSVVGSSRGIPDISWVADPNTGVAVYDSTSDNGQRGWFVVGGTSVGAPSWAALVALEDQARSTPFTSQDLITQLYNLAGTTGSSGYTNNFHDVTSGSNGHPALAGYDLVTGIGSPKANSLIQALSTAP